MNLTTDTSLALIQSAQGQNALTAESAKTTIKDKDMERINEVATDFEAMFVTEMMRPMFEQLKPDPMFGGGKGEEIFQGMMLQEYGKLMAETGQLGIADQVRKDLIRMQGGETELENPSKQDNNKTAALDTIIKELTDE